LDAPLIISASGIRGIVGRSVTPELVSRYGAAFAAFVRERNPEGTHGRYVLVGRDSRTSGELLAAATAAGVCAGGVDARLTGIGPTPTHLLAVRDDPAALGGLILTASHNPVEWNGLKLAAPDGRFVAPADGERITEMAEAGPPLATWDDLGDLAEMPGVVEHHIERILALDLVDVDAVKAARPHVVVDCVHGAGALVVPELLRRMGCQVDGIGTTADGIFPRNPEPTAENLGELCERVRRTGADFGMAVDPDSDRLALVDETGRAIGEDWTLAFVDAAMNVAAAASAALSGVVLGLWGFAGVNVVATVVLIPLVLAGIASARRARGSRIA
jgi:phosphomannomutase